MNDITLNLIVLAGLILIGVGIFLFVRRRQAGNEQKIAQAAAQYGWKYETIREPLVWGLRLKTAQWTLEALSRSSGREAGPGSSDVGMSTIWQANAPGSTFLIGPRTTQANLGSFGDMLTQQVLQRALGPYAGGLNEVHAGSTTFRQKYMFWAQDAAAAERLLSPALESALLEWKDKKILAKRTSAGLTIELQGMRLKRIDDLRSMVQLGENIL